MKTVLNFIIHLIIICSAELLIGYLFTLPENTLLPNLVANYFCLSVGFLLGVIFCAYYKPIIK